VASPSIKLSAQGDQRKPSLGAVGTGQNKADLEFVSIYTTRNQTSSEPNDTYTYNGCYLAAAHPRAYRLSLFATFRHGTALTPHAPPLNA
jgi:hypothetical protein